MLYEIYKLIQLRNAAYEHGHTGIVLEIQEQIVKSFELYDKMKGR